MKLIVGLGNPGEKYAATRHNVGFMAVDALAGRERIGFSKKSRLQAWVGTGTVAGEKAILAKPATFMNLSGEAVGSILRYYDVPPSDMLVVVDDVALPLGRLRLRASGSAGGHNGLKSVIETLGSEAFPRVRIGIGAQEPKKGDLSPFVLDTFSRGEKKILETALADFDGLVSCWIREGIDKAMSLFNKKKEEGGPSVELV